MTGSLYLISTPIGNMEDITFRAVKTIGSVDILLCEDTRHTGLLIQWLEENFKFEILNFKSNPNFKFLKPRLLSYQEFNEQRRIPEVINMLKDGWKVGLVSDAGTPTISDPGFKLVREAVKEGIKVIAVPGASAILTALVSSGLPTDKFTFLGYLPKKQGKRKELLKICRDLINQISTIKTYVCYESPYRLRETLEDIKEILGDSDIVISRELTKIHEEILRGNIYEVKDNFSRLEKIKGEITIIFTPVMGYFSRVEVSPRD